jgi:predicted nucleic acid-binding Zn ribbon protein
MKVYWDVECETCEGIFQIFVESSHPRSFEGDCPDCGPGVSISRVYVKAPGISFGGRSGAVKGSGFYATDYKDSDLVRGRAIEHARDLGLNPGANKNKRRSST